MDLEPEKPKKPLNFSCETCNFNTSNKKDYRRHILTRKHKNGVKSADIEPEIEQKTPPEFSCGKCGKGYTAKNSLWYHSKTCTVVAPPEKSTVDQSKILIELLQNNNEFKQMMVEQTNELTNKIVEVVRTNQMTITNNTNNRTINNHFNLNLFLNETCKDAMNIKDFIENIDVQMKELENVADHGYVTGITDIIVNRLKQLEVSKRPLHCTDLKREVIYIRDENIWNKDEEKAKLKEMITKVANKNYRKIPQWRIENPECKEPENEKYTYCINMMRNSLGDFEDEQVKLDKKIMKNIAKEALLDKTPDAIEL